MTAIYVKAIDENFELYRCKSKPHAPVEWIAAYDIYQKSKKEEKSEIWRELKNQFKGYLESVDEVNQQNFSNKNFLKDMLEHFDKVNIPIYREKIKQALVEFEYEEDVEKIVA